MNNSKGGGGWGLGNNVVGGCTKETKEDSLLAALTVDGIIVMVVMDVDEDVDAQFVSRQHVVDELPCVAPVPVSSH